MSHTRRSLIRSSLSSLRRLWQLRRKGKQEMRRKLGTHFEQLESRALLTGSPSFQAIADQTVLGGAPTWLGIDGTDTISGPLTYTVSIANQKNSQGQATTGLLQAIVPTGNKSLVLSTTGAETGVTGQMTYQLF